MDFISLFSRYSGTADLDRSGGPWVAYCAFTWDLSVPARVGWHVALQQSKQFIQYTETGSHILAGHLDWDGSRPDRCSSALIGRGRGHWGCVRVCLPGCSQDRASSPTALAVYNTVTYRFSRPGGKDPRSARPRRGSSRGATAPTLSSGGPKRQGPAPGCPGCRRQAPSQVIFGQAWSAHPYMLFLLNSTRSTKMDDIWRLVSQYRLD